MTMKDIRCPVVIVVAAIVVDDVVSGVVKIIFVFTVSHHCGASI